MSTEILDEVRSVRRTLDALLAALQPDLDQLQADPVLTLADALEELSDMMQAQSDLVIGMRADVSALQRRLDAALREPA